MLQPSCKISAMCHKATHEHRANSENEKKQKIDRGYDSSQCIVCSPLEVTMTPFRCNLYEETYGFYLSRESKITLLCCLKKNQVFWLPLEMKNLILDFFKKTFYPLHIYNSVTKRHFEKCPVCASRVVKFIDEHTCPEHIVLRRPLRN
jgi:hypothetical protein